MNKLQRHRLDIAFFDFDGTITFEDSFAPFIKLSTSKPKLILGWLLLLPKIIQYKRGKVTASSTRSSICKHAFKGVKKEQVLKIGNYYAENILPNFVRKKAINRINEHKKNGDKVVIVSAALDVYLKYWCKKNNLEVVCTELEERNNILTGNYLGKDCTGLEKVNRIKRSYSLENFETVYAYGDTIEDREMLSIADVMIFRWKEITNLSEIEGISDHVDIEVHR